MLNYLVYNDALTINDDGTVTFIEPAASEALQVWVDLIQNDLIPQSSLTDDHRNMVDRFSEGDTRDGYDCARTYCVWSKKITPTCSSNWL